MSYHDHSAHTYPHTHNDHHHDHHTISLLEKKSKWIVQLTAITMIIEIIAGYLTNSMALLSDGYHMGTHVLAIGLTWAVYIFIRKQSSKQPTIDTKKLLSLTGFTSGIILFLISIVILIQAIERFINPVQINFSEALLIAILGLCVNGISAYILHDSDHHTHDHNIQSAYIHVIADALTSVTAIIALIGGLYYNWGFLDSLCAIVSSLIILKWSYTLIYESGNEIITLKK